MDDAAGEELVGAAVTLGLFAAWAVHDAEDLATLAGWLRRTVPELRERFPGVPKRVWREAENCDRRDFTAAMGVMAVIVAAASAAGRWSRGRSAFHQCALEGSGLHGLVHVAQAVAVRGHTPGSATSPLLVVPFALRARGRLRRAGVLRPTRPRDLAVAPAAGAATVAAHAVARRPVSAAHAVR
ncbi:HXXEE domain-containing protein [Streptomyces sp. NPDC005931]|uniref:HXXEE domain-containing protein n=1 Tax=Streptomyces sp. NPDC005931 TaxID=3364737 RepID=UPI0036A0542F